MSTESVIASPATTSTAPSPSTLIATRGSCAHGRVCRWPLSRSMRTSSACTSLANSVASTARDGPLGSPWYKVILMSPAPAAVRLFEDRDALDQVGPSQGPACLGGGARIDGTQPPQYVRRQLVVGQRRLGQRQRIGKIEPVDVGEAVLIAGEPRPLRKLLLQHADAERHAALGLLELLFAELTVDRLAPGNAAFRERNPRDGRLQFPGVPGTDRRADKHLPADHRETGTEPLVHELHPPTHAPAVARIFGHEARTAELLVDVFHDRGRLGEHALPMHHRRDRPLRIDGEVIRLMLDRKSTRLNSSHEWISYAVFC